MYHWSQDWVGIFFLNKDQPIALQSGHVSERFTAAVTQVVLASMSTACCEQVRKAIWTMQACRAMEFRVWFKGVLFLKNRMMTESAVALGVVGIDRLGGGSGGGGPSRISDLQVRSGPKMGHCGQRGSEENTANTSKNGPELYIVIARNVLGTAQNTVNYGKICVFAFLGRCVSSLASGDGGHKTLQIALKIGCLAFSGAIFSAR